GLFPRPLRAGRRRSIRQRLGLAGRQRRQDRDRHHSRCRQSADVGAARAVDLRSVGARVLPRLPAGTCYVREGSAREDRELAVRRQTAGRSGRATASGRRPAYWELTLTVAVRATNSGVPYTPRDDVSVTV